MTSQPPGDEVLPTGIPWILKSDLDMVAVEKEPLAVCSFLRQLAVEGGLVDLDVEYHVVVPKMHPAEDFFLGVVENQHGGWEAVPVTEWLPGQWGGCSCDLQACLFWFSRQSLDFIFICDALQVGRRPSELQKDLRLQALPTGS